MTVAHFSPTRDRLAAQYMSLSRRHLLGMGLASVPAIAFTPAVRATDEPATPQNGESEIDFTPTDDGLDFPIVTWTVFDDRVDVSTPVSAGINRVIVGNSSSADEHLLTIRIPDDVPVEDFLAILSDPEAPVPEWMDTTEVPGNPDFAPVGGVAEGFIRYAAGNHVIVDPFGPRHGVFTVSDESHAHADEPVADVTIGMIEMDFTGLEEPISAGRMLIQVENNGTTIHELAFASIPDGVTKDDVLAFLASEEEGDMPSGWAFPVGGIGSGIMSVGSVAWLYATLQPGNHAALCFAPMDWAGPPHAMMGMIRTFTIVE